jgi:hypothetical protein
MGTFREDAAAAFIPLTSGWNISGCKRQAEVKHERNRNLTPVVYRSLLAEETFPELLTFVRFRKFLNFENINLRNFAVIDWNHSAYYKVRDQEVGGSNPLAPTTFFRINNLYHTQVTRKCE